MQTIFSMLKNKFKFVSGNVWIFIAWGKIEFRLINLDDGCPPELFIFAISWALLLDGVLLIVIVVIVCAIIFRKLVLNCFDKHEYHEASNRDFEL